MLVRTPRCAGELPPAVSSPARVSTVFDGEAPLQQRKPRLPGAAGGRKKVGQERDLALVLPPRTHVINSLPLAFRPAAGPVPRKSAWGWDFPPSRVALPCIPVACYAFGTPLFSSHSSRILRRECETKSQLCTLRSWWDGMRCTRWVPPPQGLRTVDLPKFWDLSSRSGRWWES